MLISFFPAPLSRCWPLVYINFIVIYLPVSTPSKGHAIPVSSAAYIRLNCCELALDFMLQFPLGHVICHWAKGTASYSVLQVFQSQ